MFGIENFIVFVTSAILLNLYPGPDSLYILSRISARAFALVQYCGAMYLFYQAILMVLASGKSTYPADRTQRPLML